MGRIMLHVYMAESLHMGRIMLHVYGRESTYG